jgi:phosphoribosylaminoimidazolecarboxamide formyltransferase / IMP cyclohydrolase
MNQEPLAIKRALISVSDKTNLIEFAEQLHHLGVEIISTGGTTRTLHEAGIPHQRVAQITEFPEIMDGRVKTLHPKIHGGILGLRDQHQQQAEEHQIPWIDLVVVNLYPFIEVTQQGCDFSEAIENIDIGGPAMIRAAAKNMGWVSVVVDPKDYESMMRELTQGSISFATRKALATKAFHHTSSYDTYIYEYLSQKTEQLPATNAQNILDQDEVTLKLLRLEKLRYGENPQQNAALFQNKAGYGLAQAQVLQGKALSYNNLVDAEAALQCVREFTEPACVVVKHANPCGVAVAATIDEAYKKAFAADSKSAFGGIIALNQVCTPSIAEHVASIFMEVIIAPAYDELALEILAKKPNLRVLAIEDWDKINNPWQMKTISGGVLIQDLDQSKLNLAHLKIVTEHKPDDQTLQELLFAWRVVKHLKSNAIAISKNGVSLGLGMGQVSRIDALELALKKSALDLTGAVLASDAFFPFKDNIEVLAKTPIKAIIQPGGSVRDQEVIDACNQHGIAMVFTGIRVFAH